MILQKSVFENPEMVVSNWVQSKHNSEGVMIMAGRRKEPVDLILIKGKSNHLTKEEIEKRRAAELTAPTDNIKYPKYLPKELRKEYNYYSKILFELGIFSNLDVDTLSRYLMAREEYLKIALTLNTTDPVIEVEGEYGITRTPNEVYDSLRVQLNTFHTHCRQLASDLGLTVSSRLKLVIPKAPEKEAEVSEFEKRFSRI